MTSQIWMVSLKVLVTPCYCQPSRCPYITQNKRFSDENVSEDIGKALAKTFARDS